MSTNLKPRLDFNCNGCRANAHSQFESSPHIHVNTNCGDKQTLGGCYGVIMYPIKNPSQKVMSRLKDIVTLNNEANAVVA